MSKRLDEAFERYGLLVIVNDDQGGPMIADGVLFGREPDASDVCIDEPTADEVAEVRRHEAAC